MDTFIYEMTPNPPIGVKEMEAVLKYCGTKINDLNLYGEVTRNVTFRLSTKGVRILPIIGGHMLDALSELGLTEVTIEPVKKLLD